MRFFVCFFLPKTFHLAHFYDFSLLQDCLCSRSINTLIIKKSFLQGFKTHDIYYPIWSYFILRCFVMRVAIKNLCINRFKGVLRNPSLVVLVGKKNNQGSWICLSSEKKMLIGICDLFVRFEPSDADSLNVSKTLWVILMKWSHCWNLQRGGLTFNPISSLIMIS